MIARQFLVYISIGGICAVIDIGIMQLLIKLGVHYLVATTFGFIGGLAVNFFMHTHITFNAAYSSKSLFRYIVVVAVNYLITIVIVELLHVWTDMALLGKLVSLPLIAINGFILSKFWIYTTLR